MSRASESLMVAEKKDSRMSTSSSARVRGDSSMEWSLLRARSESVAKWSGWICAVAMMCRGALYGGQWNGGAGPRINRERQRSGEGLRNGEQPVSSLAFGVETRTAGQ